MPLLLGATAVLVLVVAPFAAFRDSGGAHRADAAAIGATQSANANTQSAGAPPNDDFAREAYFPNPFTFPGNTFEVSFPESTAGATLEAGETASCGPVGATVWFAFNADRATTVVIDTAGSTFDTILAAYTLAGFVPSPPGGGSLTPLACNDDSGDAQSRITMTVEPHVLYNVQVGGKNGATGALQLHLECQPACAPLNDNFASTPYLSKFELPYADVRDTTAATLEQGEQRPCGDIGATVWYEFVSPPQDVAVRVDTARSDFNTMLPCTR